MENLEGSQNIRMRLLGGPLRGHFRAHFVDLQWKLLGDRAMKYKAGDDKDNCGGFDPVGGCMGENVLSLPQDIS